MISLGKLSNGSVWIFDREGRQSVIDPTDGKFIARSTKSGGMLHPENPYSRGVFVLSPDGIHTAFARGSRVDVYDNSATFGGEKKAK